jgi:hypothetical protein
MIQIENYPQGPILDSYLSNNLENEKYIIEKNLVKNFWYMKNKLEVQYDILGFDTIEMITKYAKKLVNKEFNSILISGLGMGIIPYLCQETCQIVDVVEIDSRVIELTSNVGHLNEKVRIYENDINIFQPSMSYDIILFDHWMVYAPKQEMNYLELKYNDYLNPNGFLTFPIYEQFTNQI